jgi:hypothetical protein
MYLWALVGFKETLGEDHPSTLHTVHSLGVFHQEQGQLEAEQMYLRALEGFEKTLGEDHLSTLHTVQCLGKPTRRPRQTGQGGANVPPSAYGA